MRVLAVLSLILLAAPAVAQEKFVGNDASVRTTLDFKVPAAQIQKLLPDGWEINSPSSGPSASCSISRSAHVIFPIRHRANTSTSIAAATISVGMRCEPRAWRGNERLASCRSTRAWPL